MRGALGYAWFWGAAGSEAFGRDHVDQFGGIARRRCGTQTAASLPAADWSSNSLVFDGLLTIALENRVPTPYVAQQATGTAGVGTPLTADGAGGVVEIDAALKSLGTIAVSRPTRSGSTARRR